MAIYDWSQRLNDLIQQPVIPVLVIDDVANAVPMARALVEGGLTALEITLRTPASLEAIRAISTEVEGADVGVGTVSNVKQAEQAHKAGAVFSVSPGTSSDVIKVCDDLEMPMLPGATTATEIMSLLDMGITFAKFFPAEAAGGAPFIKSVHGPLPEMQFCPTGGINIDSAKSYLSLPNVVCIGGSWIAPANLVNNQRWSEITELAKTAVSTLGKTAE